MYYKHVQTAYNIVFLHLFISIKFFSYKKLLITFVTEMALLEKLFWNVIPVLQEMFLYWVLFLLELIL